MKAYQERRKGVYAIQWTEDNKDELLKESGIATNIIYFNGHGALFLMREAGKLDYVAKGDYLVHRGNGWEIMPAFNFEHQYEEVELPDG